MSDYLSDNKNSMSVAAWHQFLDSLKDAGDNIINELGAVNARDRAEGFRYLTRLVSVGLDLHLEHADAAHPTFTRMITDTRKFIGDNPDAEYDYASLSGDRQYRIWGTRGVSTYLAFCIYGKNAMGGATVDANISDKEMEFASDGSFELILSRKNTENHANWLPLNDNTTSILVRQYFTGDRGERGTYQIEALTPADLPEHFSEALLQQRLARVGDFVKDTSAMSAGVSVFAALNSISSDHLAAGESHTAAKVIDGKLQDDGRPTPQELAAKVDPRVIASHMPTPDIKYHGAWWSLKPGEAVIIEGEPLEALYWSVQIFNRWMESPDYRYFKVDINSDEVEYEANGSFQVVLCPEDPGVKNWISTAGLNEGHICFRALKSEDVPSISYRVEKIADLIAAQKHSESMTDPA